MKTLDAVTSTDDVAEIAQYLLTIEREEREISIGEDETAVTYWPEVAEAMMKYHGIAGYQLYKVVEDIAINMLEARRIVHRAITDLARMIITVTDVKTDIGKLSDDESELFITKLGKCRGTDIQETLNTVVRDLRMTMYAIEVATR